MFATDTRASSPGFKAPVSLSRVFALFIETGVLYVVLFVRFNSESFPGALELTDGPLGS